MLYSLLIATVNLVRVIEWTCEYDSTNENKIHMKSYWNSKNPTIIQINFKYISNHDT